MRTRCVLVVSLTNAGLGGGHRSRKRRPPRRFSRICETRRPSEPVSCETVVNYDGFGAVFGEPSSSEKP